MLVTRQISITEGTAPFTILVETCGCATALQPSFTAPTIGIYSFTVDFPGNCFYDGCPVNLLVTDAENCKTTIDFLEGIEDPCNELSATILENGLTFTANATGGNGGYNYFWSYNTAFFNLVSGIDEQTLKLEVADKNGVYTNQEISLLITDGNGCSSLATVQVQFCAATLYDESTINVPCITTSYQATFSPNMTLCYEGQFANGGSFEIVSVTDEKGNNYGPKDKVWFDFEGVEISPNYPLYASVNGRYVSGSNFFQNTNSGDDDLKNFGGEFTVCYRVRDSIGVPSNIACCKIVVAPCEGGKETGPEISSCNCNRRATCDEANNENGIVLTTNLSNCFKKCDCNDPAKDINLDSFNIINGPHIAGAYVVWNAGTQELTYYAPAGSSGIDVVEYVICTGSGNCSGISAFTIYLNCIESPELENDAACTQCGLPITLNVLANDSGQNIDPSTITITTPPSNGIAYIDSNYNIVYTPYSSFNGVDTLNYIVTNYGGQGGPPVPATVSITVNCAGEGEEVTVCEAPSELIASVQSDLVCNNTFAEAKFQLTIGSYIDFGGTPIALDDGDLVNFLMPDLNVEVQFIVGENPTLPSGYQNDIGGNWASVIPFFSSGVMTASQLLAETFVLSFDKKAWADDTGSVNTYDLTTGAQIQNQATELAVKVSCTDVSTSSSSAEVAETIKKVKINAFEDNSKDGFSRKGAGTWSSSDGAVPTAGCAATCVAEPVYSWYSQIQLACANPKTTLPPSNLVAYKLTGSPAVTLSPPVALTTANAEQELRLALNSFTSLSFAYVACNYAVLGAYGLGGYNGAYAASCYTTEDAVGLEYFEITYENGTENDGKTARMTLDSIILF